MTFPEMLKETRSGMEWTQAMLGKSLGCSTQHICDLERGSRLPSVALVNVICRWIGCGPKGIAVWHRAGAKAHGWKL